ncbi:MAG: hypothetical protein ACKN9T_07410 [Candidatus Methylumidiphilus sp.]
MKLAKEGKFLATEAIKLPRQGKILLPQAMLLHGTGKFLPTAGMKLPTAATKLLRKAIKLHRQGIMLLEAAANLPPEAKVLPLPALDGYPLGCAGEGGASSEVHAIDALRTSAHPMALPTAAMALMPSTWHGQPLCRCRKRIIGDSRD